jgi:hypothetical protein
MVNERTVVNRMAVTGLAAERGPVRATQIFFSFSVNLFDTGRV